MGKLRIATWNAEGMFVEGTKTRRATPHDALATLKRLDADVVVVPEFGRLADLKDEVSTTIHALGYELVTIAYDEPRTPGLGFAIMSRLPISKSETHVLAGSRRELLEVTCRVGDDDPIHIFGVHLDDKSEAGRMTEIATIADIINRRGNKPVLLLGDFNAMHEDSRFAKLVRSQTVGRFARSISHELLRSMSDRVRQMALGTTIRYLKEHTKLRDLDERGRRTISAKQAGLEWAPAWRLAKIDWVFGSKQFTVNEYRVLPDAGSDHRPVLAVLEY